MPDLFFIFQAAFALQAAAVVLYLAYAAKPRPAIGISASGLLGASALLLLAYYGVLGLRQGRLPLASGFEALLFWSLTLTLTVLWAEWRHRLGILGAFLAPLSALTLLMGFPFHRLVSQPAQGMGDGFLLLHVSLSMAAYAFFTAAAGAAAAYLVQERQLKRKHLGNLFYQLPSLETLDKLDRQLALAGAASLGGGLVVGMARGAALGAGPLWADPKVLFNLLVWGLYALCLWRWHAGVLRGRRFAVLALWLFVLVFFGFYLVNRFFGGHAMFHGPGA